MPFFLLSVAAGTTPVDVGKPDRPPSENQLLHHYLRNKGPQALWPVADRLPNIRPGSSLCGTNPPPYAFMTPPTKGCPLLDLAVEIQHHILSRLSRSSLQSLCLASKHLCHIARPCLYAHIDPPRWSKMLHILRTLTDEDGPAWTRDAIDHCRAITVTTGCSDSADYGKPPTRCDAKEVTHLTYRKRDTVVNVIADSLTEFLKRSGGIESLHWRTCRFLPPLEDFFSALNDQPLRELHLEDVCFRQVYADQDELANKPEQFPLMRPSGWKNLTNLASLRILKIETMLHTDGGQDASCKPLDDLLARCPNLEQLKIRLAPSTKKHIPWAVLPNLAKYHFQRLYDLDLEHVAAPSMSAMETFLEKHTNIVSLAWHGPSWAGTMHSMVQKVLRTSGRRDLKPPHSGVFTVGERAEIAMPSLKFVSVTSMNLLRAILSRSAPEIVRNLMYDVRDPKRSLVNRGHDGNPVVIDDRYIEPNPMPAVTKCGSILELTVIVRGILPLPGFNHKIKELFRQIPSSIAILSIQMPDIGLGNPTPKTELPLDLPVEELSHLQSLRLLALPSYCLYHDDPKWTKAQTRGPKNGVTPVTRMEHIVKDLASRLPRLDSVYFIGSQKIDTCQRPLWQLQLDWTSMLWSPYECNAAAVVRTSWPAARTMAETLRARSWDRLGSWLHALSILPYVRHRIHTMMEEQLLAAKMEACECGEQGETNEAATSSPGKQTKSKAKKKKPAAKEKPLDFKVEVIARACEEDDHCYMKENHLWSCLSCASSGRHFKPSSEADPNPLLPPSWTGAKEFELSRESIALLESL